ncbi:hypothetical protein SS50377_26878 [Spironucleus salmonicida]|uniref:Kinesin motor domain-containing protein n=1 Tax=Spironucleus salmonicida TaxID=348837 RepID=V6M2C7_9EUKA|nr:hypothetical protein SS50377_26878 [Spironucleus salmonicida]|eukprot:EST47389.1 hypothetical protein SS50377_12376 [Spironucleus salmonicida]
MNFLALIRSKLQQEKEIQTSVQIQGNTVNFLDNTLQSFLTTEVLDQCASPKLIFELFIKNLVDASILEYKNPVLWVQGPHGSGKTHFIEGVLSQPSQRGQLFQILNYLVENQAQDIKIASFLGSYSSLYDLTNYSTSQFKNYQVTPGNKFQVSFPNSCFRLIDSADELSFFVKLTRQNTKKYKQELSGIDTLLHKIYLIEYVIENQLGKILIVDSSLFGTCDSRLRNLLSRYIQGSETLKKLANIQSPLRLQKSVNDAILEKKKLSNSTVRPTKAKPNISLRESKMLSPFRDFFEENGIFTVLTTISPIQTYYELRRDSEWFSICYKPTTEQRNQETKNSQHYYTLKSQFIKTNQEPAQTEDFAFNTEIKDELSKSHWNKTNAPETDFQVENSLAKSSFYANLNPTDLTQNALNSTQHNQLFTEIDPPEQIPLLLNSRINEPETFDFTPITENSLPKTLQTTIENLQNQAQQAELKPVSRKVVIEQKIEKYVDERIGAFQAQISDLTATLNTKQREIYDISNENNMLKRELDNAFELQSYLAENGLKTNKKTTNECVPDRQLVLQQENLGLKSENLELKNAVKKLEIEVEQAQKLLGQTKKIMLNNENLTNENVKYQQQIQTFQNENMLNNSLQQQQMVEIQHISAKNQVFEEKMIDLKNENSELKRIEGKYKNQFELCKAQESAMYEMEMEIQELKMKYNTKETEVERLLFEISRREVKMAVNYGNVEEQ